MEPFASGKNIVISINYLYLILKAGTKDDLAEIFTNGTYLEDELTYVEGYRIFGSPWIPETFKIIQRHPNIYY